VIGRHGKDKLILEKLVEGELAVLDPRPHHPQLEGPVQDHVDHRAGVGDDEPDPDVLVTTLERADEDGEDILTGDGAPSKLESPGHLAR